MPDYQVTDPTTNRTLRISGDSPPTEEELTGLFATVKPQPTRPAKIQKTVEPPNDLEEAFAPLGEGNVGGFKGDWIEATKGVLKTAPMQIASGILGFISMVDELGMPEKADQNQILPIGKYAKKAATYFQDWANEKAPDLGKGTPEYYYYSAMSSVLNNLPSLAAGFATGSQALALFSMGAQVAGNKYVELVNKGESNEKASIAAGAYGIAEAIGEKIPLHFLMKNKGLRAVLLSSLTEMPGELATEVIQAGVDYGILDENMTFAEFKDRLKETAIVTAISAPLTAGLGRGIARAVMGKTATAQAAQPSAAPTETPAASNQAPMPTQQQTASQQATAPIREPLPEAVESIDDLAQQDDTLTPEEETRYREWLKEQGVEVTPEGTVDFSIRMTSNEGPGKSTETFPEVNPEGGKIFYHGTAAEDFAEFNTDITYLSPDRDNARMFSENPILAKFQTGEQRVLEVSAKEGKTKDISASIVEAIMEDDDVDDVINQEAEQARREGYRYLSFDHPGVTDEDFTATISLYPKEDLRISLPNPSRSPGKGGQTVPSAVDHITALAARSGVNLNPIVQSTDIITVDPRADRSRAEAMGIPKEEIDAAIEAGDTFRVFGRHDLTYSEDGQARSTITLFPGATVEDVYHEFAHASDRQGKLAALEGSPEEKARFVAKEMAAGRATSLDDFVKEGMKTGPPIASPVTDFSARMDEAVRRWQTYKAWKEANTDRTVRLTEQDITDLETLAQGTELPAFMQMLGEVKGKPSVIWKESGLAKSAIDFWQMVNRGKMEQRKVSKRLDRVSMAGFINEETGEMIEENVKSASAVELETIADHIRDIRDRMQRRLAGQQEGQALYLTMKRNLERAKRSYATVKHLIRQATNQVKISGLVRESDALNAAFQKAQRASRVAFREGKKAGIDEMKYIQLIRANKERFLKEVRTLRKSIENVVKRAEKGRLDPEYREAVRGIANGSLDLAAFIAEREEKGDMLFIPEDQVQAYTEMNPADMTLGDIRNVESLVRMMAYQGRKFRQIMEYGKAVDLHDRVDEMSASILDEFKAQLADPEALPQPPSGRKLGRWERIKDTLEGLTMQLKKVEYITDWLDGFKQFGPVWKTVFRPLVEAERKSLERGNRIAVQLKEAIDLIKPNLQSIREDKTITIADGRDFTHEEGIMIALNAGNAGNLQRLTDGYKLTNEDVEVIYNQLTTEEKLFVEKIFDLVESQREEIAATYRELTGEKMTFVEGRYFPIIVDRDLSRMADRRAMDNDLMKENFYRSAVGRGFTISRRGGTDAPLLSLDVIVKHLTDTNHFVSHAVAVRDVQKVLLNPLFKESVTVSVGKNAYDQFLPWLKSVANGHYEAMKVWDRVLGRIRNNAAITILGWSLSVAIIQPMAYTQAINRLGFSRSMTGLFDFYRNFSDNSETVYELSPYMLTRTQAFDADLRNLMESDKDAIWKDSKMKKTYYALMSWSDKFITLPTWWTAYNQELRESGDQQRAVEYADKIARNTQSSGMPKDLAEVQRGSNARKIFVMFYSYFSSTYNELAKSHNMVSSGKVGYSELMKSYWWVILLPALIGTLLRKGPDWPEKDMADIMGDLAKGTITYGLGTIPIVNGIVNSMLEGYSFRPTPVAGLPEEAIKAFHAKDVPQAFKHGLMSVGYLFGIPSRQIVLTTETIWDAIDEGEINPMNLIYAEQKKKR